MPTGYTAAVRDGEVISLEEFAFQCSRAFGARITERDNDFDAPYEPRLISDYYVTNLNKAVERVNELTARSHEQWEAEFYKYVDELKRLQKDSDQDKLFYKKNYEDMLDQVKAWEPPTPEHVSFKEFMVNQLEESINFDCHTSDWYTSSIPEDVESFRASEIARARKDIGYCSNEILEEADRVIGSNGWMYDLVKSLSDKEAE